MVSLLCLPGHDGDCRDTADSLRSLQAEMGREGGDGMGQVIASFLPGVTLAISKLLTTSTNLGQVSHNGVIPLSL